MKKFIKNIALVLAGLMATGPLTAYFYQADKWVNKKTGKTVYMFHDVHFKTFQEFTKTCFPKTLQPKKLPQLQEIKQIDSLANMAKKLNAKVIIENITDNYKGLAKEPYTLLKNGSCFPLLMKKGYLSLVQKTFEKSGIPTINVENRHDLSLIKNLLPHFFEDKRETINYMLYAATYDAFMRLIKNVSKYKKTDGQKTGKFYDTVVATAQKNPLVIIAKLFKSKQKQKKKIKSLFKDASLELLKDPDFFKKINSNKQNKPIKTREFRKTLYCLRKLFDWLDVELVHHMLDAQKQHDNVFMCAGGDHCKNINKLLTNLDYKNKGTVKSTWKHNGRNRSSDAPIVVDDVFQEKFGTQTVSTWGPLNKKRLLKLVTGVALVGVLAGCGLYKLAQYTGLFNS